jgi:prophage regulatory protein
MPIKPEKTAQLVYRKKDLLTKLGVSETTLRRWMADDDMAFPVPIQLGLRAVGWIAVEVDGWLAKRPRALANACADDD